MYPDILGFLTGGPRYNVSVVQFALATRPRVVRAGRPFEAILLMQNASDVDVDVTATLQLPKKDAQGQSDRFKAKAQKLVVGLRPAEVGYVKLPVMCDRETAIHEGYELGVDIKVKPLGKPQRTRSAEGNGAIPELPENSMYEIRELGQLVFSVDKSFGLGNILQTSFSVMSGKIGRLADLSPGWVSLWTEEIARTTLEIDAV
jgi:hypothetical protein